MPEETLIPDPLESLRQQLAATNARLIQAELKAHAIRAGIVDLDGLKLLDPSKLAVDEAGNLTDAETTLASLKRDKPWLFTKSSSSHPAPPPKAEPAKALTAKDMTHAEWQAARARLISGK